MKILDTKPHPYDEARALAIAGTLNDADADWKYHVEAAVIDGEGVAGKYVVAVYDEADELVGYWNEGGTVEPPPRPAPPVQYVDYHGDDGVKTLREWALAGGVPAAREWARTHGEAWVLKADGSGFKFTRHATRTHGVSRRTYRDVRPRHGLGS